MHRQILWLGCLLLASPLWADECQFDFSQMPTNQPPVGCFSTVGGNGKPGTWKVLMDSMPLALAPLSPNAAATAPKAVVGQVAWDPADEHFPMLVLGTNTYGDFTFTTRFKMVDGLREQMAGVAFRMQDEKNYYYVRASVLGKSFYFYKVANGVRSAPIGNEVHFERGVWHQLTVQCAGPKIHILLDGEDQMTEMTDPTYSSGKIALWTKSDSISYFTDTRITYKPREPFAQTIVRDVMKEYPNLLGLKVSMVPPKAKEARLVASNDEKEIGQPGENTDLAVINKGQNYFRKEKEIVYVTMPLRDRNGDAVAAVHFVMKSFRGQTEENALVRAMPILKSMQLRASAVDSIN
jgi:hypothetical protein